MKYALKKIHWLNVRNWKMNTNGVLRSPFDRQNNVYCQYISRFWKNVQ